MCIKLPGKNDLIVNTVKPPGMRSPFVRNSECAHIFLFQLPCNALLRLNSICAHVFSTPDIKN